jgi:hypothetical protein
MKKLLLIFFLFTASLNAQTIQGYDTLALAMYCDEFLKAPKMEALSTLMNTFGDPLPCIRKRIKQGGLKLVQIDLIDATCWRNNKCPAGVPRPDDLPVIFERARRVLKLAKNNPDIQFWLSPALEHDVKDEKRVVEMLKSAQAGCPKCKVINSPYSGARPKGYPLELHGTQVKEFAVSGDGASMLDADNLKSDNNGFQHRLAGKYKTFGWIWEFNLRCTGEKEFTPPLKRTEKPSADLFKQVYQVMQKEEPFPKTPAICKSLRNISSNEINKPNAESYCNGQPRDPRGNKNLLIIQLAGKRGDKLPIYNKENKKVGDFCYFGTYDGIKGAHRWYIGDCSKQNPVELWQQLKSEWGFVKYGKDNCLRFNALRRQGIYR